MIVRERILSEKNHVRKIVGECQTDSHLVIARYTAAVAVNFTDWIGKTIPFVRHEDSYQVLVNNLRCESAHDHVGMLLQFAELSGSLPGRDDYVHVAEQVGLIRSLFTDSNGAGLCGIALCAFLENTSEIFIPDLARRAKECGCTDFTYTDIHGEADIEHSEAFIRALQVEYSNGGYFNPDFLANLAMCDARKLIAKIYS